MLGRKSEVIFVGLTKSFQNLIGMLGREMFRSDEDANWKFQNLIGMLGRNFSISSSLRRSAFQNLIGMLGSGKIVQKQQ